MNKLEHSQKIIETYLSVSKKPIVMCSFGKDSIVLLHIIREINKDVPVLFFREPFEQKKYTFANKVIIDWDLWVYDYNPASTEIMFNNGHCDVAGLYNTGNVNYIYKPVGLKPITNGNRFICAVDDIVNRPKGQFDYKWDVTFHGGKDTDIDPLHGKVAPPKDGISKNGNTLLVYPLIYWTDADIWEYIEKNGVPYDEKRYNKNDGFKEFKGFDYNTDYFESCYECLNPENESFVYCQKENGKIKNTGKETDYLAKLNELEKCLSMTGG